MHTRRTRDQLRWNRSLDRLARRLPRGWHYPLAGLRASRARWLRLPLALLLILGGLFAFLPLLGLWMLPLGLVLLAQDIPWLRRPLRVLLVRGERRWMRWRRTRAARARP